MACGDCKSKNVNIEQSIPEEFSGTFQKVARFVVATILLIIMTPITLAVVIPYSVYMLFRLLYFRESGLDMTGTLMNIGKYLKNRGEMEEEDEPIYDFDEDQEYEIVGVDLVESSLN